VRPLPAAKTSFPDWPEPFPKTAGNPMTSFPPARVPAGTFPAGNVATCSLLSPFFVPGAIVPGAPGHAGSPGYQAFPRSRSSLL
jgi:hypothetical protein